jgi:hypothetical protein
MATSESQRRTSRLSRTPSGHLSALQAESNPQSMSVGRVAWSLMRDFPGWLCWYGRATRVWWGMPPSNSGYRALIEAATPDELAARVHQMRAFNQHIADRPHS